MSVLRIAGSLALSCDGQLEAVLRDWWLDGDGVAFTMEMPLSLQVLDNLKPLPGYAGLPRGEMPDAVLEVSWATAQASAANLRIPPKNSAVGVVVSRVPEEPWEPHLDPVRSVIDRGQWKQGMKFAPLPEGGELAFRLTSRVLDIRRAVGWTSVERLRSRIV